MLPSPSPSLHPHHVQSGPIAWCLTGVVACLGLLGLAGQVERAGFHNWDLMGYLGCLMEWQSDDASEVHRRVLEVVRSEVPAERQERLLGHARYRNHPDYAWGRAVATDAEAFSAQLDWYRPRIGFTALLAAVHAAGLPPLAALRTLVLASYVALGLLLWLWTGRRLGPWIGLLVALAVAASLPLAAVAKLLTADLTAAFLLLAGVFVLSEFAVSESVSESAAARWPGAALTASMILWALAVTVRPDYLLYCLPLLAAIAWPPSLVSRASRRLLAAAAAGLTALYLVLAALGGHPGWTRLFYFTFVERTVDHDGASVGLGDYLGAVAAMDWDLGSTTAPLFLAAAVVLALGGWRSRNGRPESLAGSPDPTSVLTVALLAASLVRFLLFPVAWDRFWIVLELWMIVALATLVTLATTRPMPQDREFKARRDADAVRS